MLHGNAKVEYEPRQICDARVQCPKCKKWFYPCDITTFISVTDLASTMDGSFICPMCEVTFAVPYKNIEETSDMPKAMTLKRHWIMED